MISCASPGTGFAESMLLGSGRIGVSIPGQVGCERLTLTHQDFWSGCVPTAKESRRPASVRLARSRALEGDLEGMEQALLSVIGEKGQYGTSLPAADLVMQFPDAGPVSDYRRCMDPSRGEVSVRFLHGTSRQERLFSFAGHTLCLDLTDRDGTTLCLHLEGPCLLEQNWTEHECRFLCRAQEEKHSDGHTGSGVLGRILLYTDARVHPMDQGIMLEHLHVLHLLLGMNSDLPARLHGMDMPITLPLPDCTGGHVPALPRLTLPNCPDMVPVFELGIYLAAASSAPDSLLPASLQGVWNDGVASRIGWTCDMHLDVNTQMNEWVRGPAGLGLSPGLLRWASRLFLGPGREQATHTYALPGTVAEMTSNAWGYAAPYWHPSLAPCPACGWWLMLTLTDLWYYEQDMHILREQILPLLRLHVEFVLGWYADGAGYPSVSPENAYLMNGKKHYASLNPAFELTMARGILETWLDLTERAGETGLCREAGELLERLERPRILMDGTIAEFGTDAPPADVQHRHISHLLGLFPLFQITPEDTPELARAAEKTLEKRTLPRETWEDTGWSRSMLALYEARLHHGDACLGHLRHMLEKLSTASGLIMHPPTRGAQAPQDVWEMDGNTGFSMAVMEMLVQSGPDWIRLLPALPHAWDRGSLGPVHTRCGALLSMEWEEGTVKHFRLIPRIPGRIRVLAGNESFTLDMVPGKTIIFEKGTISCM